MLALYLSYLVYTNKCSKECQWFLLFFNHAAARSMGGNLLAPHDLITILSSKFQF